MAGVKPGFITGANARVKLGGKTLAYCTDLSFTVDVATIPIEVIGTYEVKSYEPVAYSVNGSFSVIRYTKNDKGHSGTAEDGNAADRIGSLTNAAAGTSIGSHLDPGRMLTSATFDIEIHQATAAGDVSATNISGTYKIYDCRVTRRSSSVNKRGVMVDNYAFVGVLGGDTDTTTVVSGSGYKDLV